MSRKIIKRVNSSLIQVDLFWTVEGRKEKKEENRQGYCPIYLHESGID